MEVFFTKAEQDTFGYTNAFPNGRFYQFSVGFGAILRSAIGAAAEHSAGAGTTGEGHAQAPPSAPGSTEAHTVTSQQTAGSTTHGVADSQVHATGGGRSGCASAGYSAARKAPPPIPPDSDEDSQPVPATTATPRKAPLNTTAPVQQRTPTPSAGPAKASPPPLVQDDNDPWNDFSQQRADPIVELVTPAVALARSSSPQRVHRIEPQLGPRPRVVDPSILQAPQHPSTPYSVWDDTWHTQPSPEPQQFPPAALPPLHPAPSPQPAPILRPLAPAAPSQQYSIFTEGLPRPCTHATQPHPTTGVGVYRQHTAGQGSRAQHTDTGAGHARGGCCTVSPRQLPLLGLRPGRTMVREHLHAAGDRVCVGLPRD